MELLVIIGLRTKFRICNMTNVILFHSNNNSHNSVKNIIQVLWQRTKINKIPIFE